MAPTNWLYLMAETVYLLWLIEIKVNGYVELQINSKSNTLGMHT